MTRIACLLVPLFPLAARLRAEPELAGETVAVCEGNGAAARITAASRPARQLGVRAGMTLAQARGVLPSLIARGRDPGCERSAHEALLEVAWTLSPQVEDTADEAGWSNLGTVGQKLINKSPEFDPRTYGYKKLVDLIVGLKIFEFKASDPFSKSQSIYIRVNRPTRS